MRRVPHPTTLMKITNRCGPDTIDALNEMLLTKAAEAKVVRLDKVRADTTVVEADVAYPTDSGLLARGVARMAALTTKLKGLGLASRTRFRDRTRSMRRRAHNIGAWLRRRTEVAKHEVYAITADMANLADAAVGEARAVVRNARRALRTRGSEASGAARAAVAELERVADLVERIAAQTRTRLGGEPVPGATRIVSLHDPDARPIVKGRLGRPVEFGYLAQVVDNRDGVVVDHGVHIGNPPDAPLLAPAVERIKARFGRAPRAVAADRGYGEAAVDDSARVHWCAASRHPPSRSTGRRPPERRARPTVPSPRQVAHRHRRSHQPPQTRLLLEPHPTRRHQRRTHLVRARRPRPQHGQDRRPHRRTRPASSRTVNRIEADAALRFTTSSRTPHRFRRLTVRRSYSSRPQSTKEPENTGSTK